MDTPPADRDSATFAAFSVLLVCMGNVCRSPMAQGVLRHQIAQADFPARVLIDSAGTHCDPPGCPPDALTQAHAKRRGYDLSDLRARALEASDFARFDLVLVMDWDVLALVQQMCPPLVLHKVRRLTEFCRREAHAVVHDPHHGGEAAFEQALAVIEDACDGLLRHIRQQLTAD